MQPSDDRRCTATSKQTGNRCGAWAMPAQRVCKWHGGMAPAALAKAELRMADLIQPAIRLLAATIDDDSQKRSDQLRAAENAFDRGGVPRRAELDLQAGQEALLERLRALPAPDPPDA